jgi:hypothetical protein
MQSLRPLPPEHLARHWPPVPLPTDRTPALQADIANTLAYARSYEGRGIAMKFVMQCWAAGFSVEQVEAHADSQRGRL